MLVAGSISLPAIEHPVEPTEPIAPQMKDTQATETYQHNDTSSKPEENTDTSTTRLQLKVKLGSGATFQGAVSLPQSFEFRHSRDNVVFTKKVYLRQVAKIEIIGYSASQEMNELKTALTEKSHRLQQNFFITFRPQEYMIVLKNGLTYKTDTRLAFLDKFRIDTRDGYATLYSYFGDTWSAKGWHSIKSTDPEAHYTLPHPQAVQIFEFMYSDKSGI